MTVTTITQTTAYTTAGLNNNIPTEPYVPADVLNNGGGMAYQVVLYIVVLAAVIVGLIYARKYLLKRVNTIRGGKYMRVTDTLAVAQDKQIIMLEVGEKIIVAGVTQTQMSTLYTMDREELKELPPEEKNEFGSVLKNTVKKISGGQENRS